MRTSLAKTAIWSLASILLATLLTLNACGGDGNSGGNEKYAYCLLDGECLVGPFELSACSGQLSNSCPAGYETGSQTKPSSSSGGYAGEYGSVTDDAGTEYKTVEIGTQVWMAENLDYAVAGSKCYGEGGMVYLDDEDDITLSSSEIQSNCAKYGRLYDWATAMALPAGCNSNTCSGMVQTKHRGICPSGWHIPSGADWDVLMRYVQEQNGEIYTANSNASIAGKHLKATSSWYGGGNGLDTYGFAALPGGDGDSEGDFFSIGELGFWWSSLEANANRACGRIMVNEGEVINESDGAYWEGLYKAGFFSIRCIKD